MGQLYDSADTYDSIATYDGGLPVPVVAPSKVTPTALRSSAAAARQSEQRMPWSAAAPKVDAVRLLGREASTVNSEHTAQWRAARPRSRAERIAWGAAQARESMVRAAWSQVLPRGAATRLRVDMAARKLSQLIRLNWPALAPKQAATAILWGAALARQFGTTIPWANAYARGASVRIRWRPGAPYTSGYTFPIGGDPDPPPGSTIVIPPAEVYFMIPSLTIVRDSDGADLGAINATVRLDSQSYAWTLDAAIPLRKLPLVSPATRDAPESVLCTINGYPIRFLIESFADDRKFGATGARLRGRGQAALLSGKYAPRANFTSTENKDASQLATDLLPDGWTLNWNSPDWPVNAGMFTYADAAPIDAIAQIVNAIGSIILPDRTDKVLTVQPYYPTSPWEWDTATPYADVPASFLGALSGTWDGPFEDYNGIVVSGQNGGVVGTVKRTGTDSEPQLPPVNDVLICHVDAARERGRIEIAKGNKRKSETIRALLLPPGGEGNPGIFLPGHLLKVTERSEWASSFWLGQVTGVQIDAQKGNSENNPLLVRQTITLDRFA